MRSSKFQRRVQRFRADSRPYEHRSYAGPAFHFLSRLGRLDPQQAEIALFLYRNRSYLMSVLRAANLPKTIERIAISLDDRERGPFLVVTRDGHFVTCLGSDMLHNLNVIPETLVYDALKSAA